ncbi:kinesin family member 4/21/27 [Fistulifera solaris]|uniref:Kinesin family member 4/21/27 n=1 Tax=Fistulifera solaris TaxID=1519565 RepID=A0A1Z5J907_FISSO|nr:kinesin family member 4/21/27 [Fistulifera solaris]|eukprot:GAX10308.1 kinesin family member 4/21/27 [Fistulifera solaris]
MTSSRVRVAVRVRPLGHQEVAQGGTHVVTARHPEIRLGERRFTFDSVFDTSVSQAALFDEVSGPLQTSFLDGYNATIMAYGQTGSGKTFTMGSEAHSELEITDSTGLIPRFMSGVFEELEQRRGTIALSQYKLEASFLEVYGEDVHDLLLESRPSLPLREGANGGIVCPGLTMRHVQTAEQALEVLHEGTKNRTTAATLMNLTSSRSHAVFTVTLTQTAQMQNSDVEVTTTSRFTFVDLAGSERLKKTGAEGTRAKEGIKINEGLLALGNVINALADDERLLEGKKMHVPYRQSKLTRLLQDALGGNSQTLFLACISPSDTNASESLSTLHYANRARNIKNAPTKNVDSNVLEMHRLQAYNNILQSELVKLRFGGGENENPEISVDELLMKSEVNDYLSRLHQIAMTSKEGSIISHHASVTLTSPKPSKLRPCPSSVLRDISPNKSIFEHCDADMLTEVNPDEEMSILNHLLELQQKTQDFDDSKRKDDEALKAVTGELAEQEAMLLQLRDSLKVYHHMKDQYEKLMVEVQHLETEKAQLAEQLEKAKSDPSAGCSVAIKLNLEKVEQNLARARDETRKYRQMCKKAEQEQQKCLVLERKVSELKSKSAALVRKQKAAAAQFRDYTESKQREIATLKRKEKATEKKMSKLQSEIQIHRRNLDKRQVFCNKLSSKLKETETHLMKLLALRKKECRERYAKTGNHRATIVSKDANIQQGRAPADDEVLKSIKMLVDRVVSAAVSKECAKKKYQSRFNEYTQTMRLLVDQVNALEGFKSTESGDSEDGLQQEAEQQIEELELKIELLAGDLEQLSSELPADEEGANDALEHVNQLLGDKEAPVLRSMLAAYLQELIHAEFENKQLSESIKRKESVVEGLESEIAHLSSRISILNTRGEEHETSLVEVEKQKLEIANQSLASKVAELEDRTKTLKKLETEDRIEKMKLATALERVALLEAALKQKDVPNGSEMVLRAMQGIWEKLGTSIEDREKVKKQIENCLDDTCNRKLEEAQKQLECSLSVLERETAKMQFMYLSLAEDIPMLSETQQPVYQQLEEVQTKSKSIEAWFETALKRRDEIADQAQNLVASLELEFGGLSNDLQVAILEAGASRDQFDVPMHLEDSFLSSCEAQLRRLRVEKSKATAKYASIQTETQKLIADMNLPESAILPMVHTYLEKQSLGLPSWWRNEIAAAVTFSLVSETGFSRHTSAYVKHLSKLHEIVTAVSLARGHLSAKLKGIVQKAQETLLDTVDEEIDAKEAYSSFHDALFRLPPLSREMINACSSEVDALLTGVQSMIQSEIEALTVVWEALDISSSKRGTFWGEIQESMRSIENSMSSVFDGDASSNCIWDLEDWILPAKEKATVTFLELEKLLFKLQKIHKEVERLSAKQDVKSRIISLDSEIRILNAKLAEFEETKCDKERLITKKATSSTLLKEERYRKQMQSKFSAKFAQLASLLKTWSIDDDGQFDPRLLSEEVRILLANSNEIDSLVEKRTEFMHLRTIQPKTTNKRKADGEVQPRKIARIQSRDNEKPLPLPSRLDAKNVIQNMASCDGKKLSPLRAKKTQASGKLQKAPRVPLSNKLESSQVAKGLSPKKKLTLPPFGHVLEKAFTPRDKNKENEII